MGQHLISLTRPHIGDRIEDVGALQSEFKTIQTSGLRGELVADGRWGSIDLGGTIGTLSGAAKLRVAHWKGAADGPGTVIIVQGRAEFMEQYEETIADFRRDGFEVVAFDFRGQGGSVRRPSRGGHIDSFRHYVEDLLAVVRFAAEREVPRPVMMVASSMGGLVALSAMPQLVGQVDRMVLLAPLLKIAKLPLPQPIVRFVCASAALIGLSRALPLKPRPLPTPEMFDGNLLTSDRERFARYCELCQQNPELVAGPPTFGWVRAAFKAMSRISRMRHTTLPIPTLFAACGHDRIVSTVEIDAFARSVYGGGLVLLRGARHQALIERDDLRALFFAAFQAFLPEREGAERLKRTGRPLKFAVGSHSDAPVPSRRPKPQKFVDELPEDFGAEMGRTVIVGLTDRPLRPTGVAPAGFTTEEAAEHNPFSGKPPADLAQTESET